MTSTNVVLPEEDMVENEKVEDKNLRIDFDKKTINEKPLQKRIDMPFVKAKTKNKRMKVFVFGEPGTYKTRTALNLGDSVVVVDTENGSSLYGNEFGHYVLNETDPGKIMDAVKWLLTNKHPYQTLVVDSITLYWDALQDKWNHIFMEENQMSKGHKHQFYDMQPGDWKPVKAELKRLIRYLLKLDMNVIVTAREKVKYKGGTGDFMKIIGQTFDGEKGLAYEFDTVMRFFFEDNDTVMCMVEKDRTNKFPKKIFKHDIDVFKKVFGDNLSRESVPVKMITSPQKKKIEKCIKELGISEEKIERALQKYEASSLDELTKDNAEFIKNTLELQIANKEN